MRIGCDPSVSSTATPRHRVASPSSDNAFADTLASAVESADSRNDAPEPELSAATYRLFAAIDLERGDTKHAELHLSRVPDAREAGLPRVPTGLLSDVGRWDYTEAAAALPETGKFDTATGQGVRTFVPYNARPDAAVPTECAAENTTARASDTAATSSDDLVARRRGSVAGLAAVTRGDGSTRTESAEALAALLDTLPS
jgi:hypothetical protein